MFDVPIQPLTEREEDVLQCIVDGFTNRETAEQLVIARSTVKWYVRQIYYKLGVDTRDEAIDVAQQLGFQMMSDQFWGRLPHHTLPFVGRREELRITRQLMQQADTRLLTLYGLGGIGKTRLAVEMLQPLIADYEGCYYIEAEDRMSASQFYLTLASTLRYRIKSEGLEPDEQVLTYLQDKPFLLLLDSFENVGQGTQIVADLLQETPVELVVCSRVRLGVQAEQAYFVRPLLYPTEEPTEEPTAADPPAIDRDTTDIKATSSASRPIEQYDSAQLFLRVARRSNPAFSLTDAGDASDFRRLMQLTQGHPLALTLAASWSHILPVSRILAILEADYDGLADSGNETTPGHGIQASFNLSWQQLDAHERAFACRFGVFEAEFDAEAALQICQVTVDELRFMADRAFIQLSAETDRYQIHSLLHHFLLDRLRADGQAEAVMRRFAECYLGRMADSLTAIQQGYPPPTRQNILRRLPHTLRAWHWAIDRQDVSLLGTVVESLYWFFRRENRLSEWIEWAEAAIAGLAGLHNPSVADYSTILRGLSLHDIDDAADLASFIEANGTVEQCMIFAINHGGLLSRSNRSDRAIACFRQLIELAQQAGADFYEASAWWLMSSTHLNTGNFSDGRAAADRASQLFIALHDPFGQLMTTSIRAAASLYSFDRMQFLQIMDEIRAAATSYYSPSMTTYGRVFEAEYHLLRGRFGQARDIIETVLPITEQYHMDFSTSMSLSNAALVTLFDGDAELALTYALRCVEKARHPSILSRAQGVVGYAYIGLQDSESAVPYLYTAVQANMVLQGAEGIRLCFLPAVAIVLADEHPMAAAEALGAYQTHRYTRHYKWHEHWSMYRDTVDALHQRLGTAAWHEALHDGETQGERACFQKFLDLYW